MGTGLKEYRKALEWLKGKRNLLETQIKKQRQTNKKLRRSHRYAEKARIIIQVVAQQTQEELRYQLTELPKLALQGVFDDPYDFLVDFELRRSKTEVDFWFGRQGEKINPKEGAGLGPVDIAGTALRCALWSLKNPRNRPILFLDEPFKHLKGIEANSRALAMLKDVCQPRPQQNWPGLQIIMIADERAPREELLDIADRLFEFSIRKRKTIVTMIKK